MYSFYGITLCQTKEHLEDYLDRYSYEYYDDDNVDLEITETTAGYVVAPIWRV